ncbi:MAG: PorV/PorQ family protein [bacterium]
MNLLGERIKAKGKGQKVKSVYFLLLACTFAFLLFNFDSVYALTADPMDVSVGARSMGMGKAYVAVAEDAETVFVNPAGLGAVSSLKLSSMYTSLLDDMNYTVISGVYPMDNNSGTLGAGIVNQVVSDIRLYNDYGTAEGTGTYGSNVFFVSHGFDLSKKIFPYTKNLYGGYTLKYFMKSASGLGASDMSGSGFAADMGLLYKPKGYVSYGLTLQNIIAGTMNYASGQEDEIGSAMKVGTQVAVMGDVMDGGAIYQSDSKVDVACDYDIGIRGKVPATLHLGAEYQPQIGVNYIDRILTLRGGINQIPTPAGSVSNITMGVGVNYQGVEFNYAYSPMYGDIPGTSTQFFSISYVGVPTPVKPIEEMKPLISQAPLLKNVTPDDKVITGNQAVLIRGAVGNPADIAKVEINNVGVNVSDTGSFNMNVPLSTVGKHLVDVRATDVTGKTEERQIKVIRLMKFADISENHWASLPIGELATVGLIEGYPNGTFQADRALSRAELATLLVKSKGIEPPAVTTRTFKDMPPSHWAARYVKSALAMGLVNGYPDGTFKPNNKITRTEGVVVLTRFNELQQQASLPSGPYPDLTARFWASPFIASARSAGLLDYIGDNDFEPKRELTRAEAVEILSKTNYGKARLSSLLDWNVGFEPEIARPAVAAYPTPAVSPSAGMYGRPMAGSGAVTQQIREFADVPDGFWANNSIKYLAAAGVMNGYPDGMFKPDRIVTRAELASMLVKAKNIPIRSVYTTAYSDVSRQSWAASYIKAAVDAGYVTGRKGNKFEPDRGATRAEAVAALVKFDNLELPANLRAGPFMDMTAKEWSSKYVAAAKDAGMLDYLQGQDFEAEKSITRAELAELISKTRYGQAKIEQIKSAGVYE